MTDFLVTAFAIVWLLIWIFAIVSIVAAKRKGLLNNTKKTNLNKSFRKADTSQYAFRMPGQPKKSTPKTTPSRSLIKDAGGMLLEDRENDWLARQIREEDRIMRRGSELDAGAAHSRQCQADTLKKKHLFEHDDSIDNAEY